MRQAIRLASVLLPALFAAGSAGAGPSKVPFAAPGLWEIVSDVQGPLQQRTRITQEECWNTQGESGQAMTRLSGGGRGAASVTHSVVSTGSRSTVRLLSVERLPRGTVTQDLTMVFVRDGDALRRATMTGKGKMTFTASPSLDETITQRGNWIAAACPPVLPAARTTILQQPLAPALADLQKLATRLQAQDPRAGGR